MDLIAYAQMDGLGHILKELGIEVPRLRGLDLMTSNEPYTAEEVKGLQKEYTEYKYKDMCEGCNRYCLSKSHFKQLAKKNGGLYEGMTPKDFGGKGDWINGRNKKLAVSLYKGRLAEQVRQWNEHCGKNVLRIHARIGRMWYDNERTFTGVDGKVYDAWGDGKSVRDHTKEIEAHPRFLGWCKDAFDETYCDIYFDIEGL